MASENETVDFDTLLNDCIKDSSLIDSLPEDQVNELRKRIAPGGRTIAGEKKLCCMSVINVSQEYMKKWLMTGMIGFLFRGCDEYNAFDDEPVVNLDDFTGGDRQKLLATLYRDAIPARNELATLIKKDREIKEHELAEYYEANKADIAVEEAEKKLMDAGAATRAGQNTNSEEGNIWQIRAIDKNGADLREQQMRTLERVISRAENMTKRIVIREFLDGLFTFNPDMHVRGSYGFNPLDPERKEIKTATAKKSNRSWKKKDVFDMRKGKTDNNEAKPDEDEVDDVDECHGDTDTRKTLTKHIPPADTYFKLQMYMDDHHDRIKDAVVDIYHEKADIEWMINPYQVFDDDDAAKKFVHKYSDDVKWNIETLYTHHWNLMGSFSKNKERTDFLNDNTEVVTEYLDQVESDKKMGRQLMMKKAQRKKLANVGADGPDSKLFRKYKSEFASTAEAMGAVDLSNYAQQKKMYDEYQKSKQKERERLANVTRAPNGAITANTTDLSVRSGINVDKSRAVEYPDAGLSDACPDDAIQVDVINMTQGGLEVQRSNFFTEAEAPSTAMGEQKK